MSDKVRVFEIAEEVGKTSVEVMQKAKELGILLILTSLIYYHFHQTLEQFHLDMELDSIAYQIFF
ncbi:MULTISPECIES: translation initiation factor IF-2 N-terminal domain-containing protein [Aliarcobacter]|uniref:translation initiation factor IF-2 N-terminal domain-containing protein n=1 Tax=Aliarcobacter TaxID=2321111 RepID=UPI0036F43C11